MASASAVRDFHSLEDSCVTVDDADEDSSLRSENMTQVGCNGVGMDVKAPSMKKMEST